jgi:Tfp pilus assembly protein PilO
MAKLNIPNIDLKNIDLAKLKNLKKEDILRHKVALIGTAIVLFSLWYAYNKIYVPTMSAVRQAKTEASQEGVNTDISRRLADLHGQMKKYEAVFTRGADMPWLVDKISNAAAFSGLNIISLDSKPLVRLKNFIYSRTSVTASGNFHQLGDFVSRLESSGGFIRVENLFFTKDKEKIALEAKMIVSTYFMK